MLAVRVCMQGNPFVRYKVLVDICLFFSRTSYPAHRSNSPRAFSGPFFFDLWALLGGNKAQYSLEKVEP